MTIEVRSEHEVALDIPAVTLPDGTVKPALGVVRFRTQGPIRSSLVSIFPAKEVSGDYSRDTEQVASSHIFSDWTGGVGVYQMAEKTEADTFWDAYANTLYRGQLTLPWKAVEVDSGGAPTTAQVRAGTILNEQLYVAFDGEMRKFNNATSAFEATVPARSLSAAATDATSFDGVAYFAFGSGIESFDGSTWAQLGVEQQTVTISGTPTGGTYTLHYDGNDTTALAYDADGAAVQAALRAIAGLEKVEVTTTGSSPDYTHTIDFVGVYTDPPELTSTNNLTGGVSPAIAHATASAYEDLPADFLVQWDSKLWKIADDGTSFASSPDAATWTARASLKVPAGDVQSLRTFYNTSGDESIFAITKTGPYVYDATNDKWLRAKAQVPRHRRGGSGSTSYRNQLFWSAGLEVFQFTGEAFTKMGLANRWGLPKQLRGYVRQLAATPAVLVALVDASQPKAATNNFFTSQLRNWGSAHFPLTEGYATVWAWNDRGWHPLWRSSATGTGATWLYLTDLFEEQRLWIGADNKAYYLQLPEGFLNPLQNPDLPYAESGFLITPWFDAQWSELDKAAIQLQLRTKQMSATELVRVYVGYDGDDDSWSLLTTITANQLTTFDFNNGLGQDFRSVRFKFELERGATETSTPVLEFAVLKYLKVLRPVMGHVATLMLDEPYDHRTVQEQIDALEQAMWVKGLMESTFRDGMGKDQTRKVRLSRFQNALVGGTDWRGRADVSLIET